MCFAVAPPVEEVHSYARDHFILNADNVNCKHCDCVLKYNDEHHETI